VTGGASQERAPIWETLTRYVDSGIYAFHTPGHKGGRFAPPELVEMIGARGLALDLPSMTATDNTFHPSGCVREAQELASELFGSAATFFLSAGSTLGVAAALVAAVPPGETVLLPRNIHRSVVAGLVISGAVPRFVHHEALPECGALGVTAEAVAARLDESPKPAAVLLTRPSYYGLARDLEQVVEVCHARQVPLIVDEAHGAHLHFLPAGGVKSAIAAGADVVVQSCHKTLGSLVGSAQMHVGQDALISPSRVQDALNFLQTTSPNYLMLASLDVMRRWLWREGRELFARAVNDVRRMEDEVEMLPGIRVLRPEREDRLTDHGRDPLRVVVNVGGTGWTGYEVERHLRTQFHVEDEMADLVNVVYIFSPRDEESARKRLLAGLKSIAENHRASATANPQLGRSAPVAAGNPQSLPIPPLAMPPRDAALGKKTTAAFASSPGRVCAEMVMFYPPGIPLLMPGEVVTQETIDVCRQLLAAGGHPYASDPSLETLQVVEG
jgi:arginine decarboxylase